MSTWELYGSQVNLIGTTGANFGTNVYSTDNNIIAIGTYFSDPSATSYASVFQYGVTGVWELLGNQSNLVGQMAGDNFGSDLALSANGYILAVGAPNYSQVGSGSDYVNVFRYDGVNTWNLMGNQSNLVGINIGDAYGGWVNLSDDGTILLVGAGYGRPDYTGYINIYKYDGGTGNLGNWNNY